MLPLHFRKKERVKEAEESSNKGCQKNVLEEEYAEKIR